ncbi:MAG: aldehyde ferredoxin oxidoreductase C-terminal domain-containing protein [Halobacteriales archaeon]
MTYRRPDRLLRVDLSARRVTSERVPAEWRRRYLGGKGLGARYLYDELAPGTDPLGPENVLMFLLGPLTGALPGTQRYAAVTKSPLTGTFLDSYAGGDFPAKLGGALEGHLGVLVTGQADEPVALVVEDGDGRIEPTEVWGADAVETSRAYDGAVACVGPAGEQEVAFATIASDEAEHHAGRGGAGAVMGAKRLKAVVARGDPVEPPDAVTALRERDESHYETTDVGRWLGASGTAESVDFADETDVLPSAGWQERGFDGTEDIGIEAVREAATERTEDGGFRVDTDEGESVPRGATAMTLGAGLGLDDFDAVATLGERCNRLGLDLIDAGNAVALAILAAREGLVDRDLAFSDPDGARALLGEIATRSTPLGDALAEGIEAAAASFDDGEFIPTVKGMAMPSYDPRGSPGMALAYATSDRGACHRRARPVEEEAFDPPWEPSRVAAAVAAAQNRRSVRWSLIADDFVGEVLDPAEWLDAVDWPHDDLARTGERIWTVTRLFNVREGFDRRSDGVPDALDERGEFSRERFETTLDEYYAVRGWSAEGVPTRATLERLELLDTVDAATPVAAASIDR